VVIIIRLDRLDLGGGQVIRHRCVRRLARGKLDPLPAKFLKSLNDRPAGFLVHFAGSVRLRARTELHEQLAFDRAVLLGVRKHRQNYNQNKEFVDQIHMADRRADSDF
jgi:hypothetical protein